jgi:hypothetical protein
LADSNPASPWQEKMQNKANFGASSFVTSKYMVFLEVIVKKSKANSFVLRDAFCVLRGKNTKQSQLLCKFFGIKRI